MKTYKSKIKEFSLVKNKTDFNKVKITGSMTAAKYSRNFYQTDIGIYESFFMMMLNNQNNTIGYVKISQGGISGTLVDVRILAKYAIESLCSAVILVHNHPSGSLKPSNADRDITKKIKDTLNLFDVRVLDHIIIIEKEDNVQEEDLKTYFSFADNGEL